MKNRILILMLSMVFVLACSSDPLVNDVNLSVQKEVLQVSSKKKPVKRPFKLKAAGTYGAFAPDNGSCLENLALNAYTEGNATHLGRIMQIEEWCWNGTQPDLGSRSITIKAANGSELYGTPISVMWSSDFDFMEVVMIDGGTGRFENATGEFQQTVVISREAEPSGDNVVSGTYSVSGSGTITY